MKRTGSVACPMHRSGEGVRRLNRSNLGFIRTRAASLFNPIAEHPLELRDAVLDDLLHALDIKVYINKYIILESTDRKYVQREDETKHPCHHQSQASSVPAR